MPQSRAAVTVPTPARRSPSPCSIRTRRRTPATVVSALALALAASSPVAAPTPAPVGATPAVAPVPPPVDPAVRYAGVYQYIGGDRERGNVNVAIERATEGMVFFIRPIANGRIRAANPVPGAVAIRFPPGQ